MSMKPAADTTIDQEGVNGTPATTGGIHRPGHSSLDTEDVAARDELQHEAALRDSCLRTPR